MIGDAAPDGVPITEQAVLPTVWTGEPSSTQPHWLEDLFRVDVSSLRGYTVVSTSTATAGMTTIGASTAATAGITMAANMATPAGITMGSTMAAPAGITMRSTMAAPAGISAWLTGETNPYHLPRVMFPTRRKRPARNSAAMALLADWLNEANKGVDARQQRHLQDVKKALDEQRDPEGKLFP